MRVGKNTIIKWALFLSISYVPVFILGYVLEYFGSKKMGFMRYLVFMKYELGDGILNSFNIKIILYGIVFLTLISVILIILKFEISRKLLAGQALTIVWLQMMPFYSLKSWYFITIGILIVFALQCIFETVRLLMKKNNFISH